MARQARAERQQRGRGADTEPRAYTPEVATALLLEDLIDPDSDDPLARALVSEILASMSAPLAVHNAHAAPPEADEQLDHEPEEDDQKEADVLDDTPTGLDDLDEALDASD